MLYAAIDPMGIRCVPSEDEYMLAALAGGVPAYEADGELLYPCCYTVDRMAVDPSAIDEMAVAARQYRVRNSLGGLLDVSRVTRALRRRRGAAAVAGHDSSEVHMSYRRGRGLTADDLDVIRVSMAGHKAVAVDVPPDNYLYHMYSYVLPDVSYSVIAINRFRARTVASNIPVVLYASREYPGMVAAVHILFGVVMRAVITYGAAIPDWMYDAERVATVAVCNLRKQQLVIRASSYIGGLSQVIDRPYDTGALYCCPDDISGVLRALTIGDVRHVCLGEAFDYMELMRFAADCGLLVRQRFVEYAFPTGLPVPVLWHGVARYMAALPAWVVYGPSSSEGQHKLVGYHWAGRDLRIGAVMGIVSSHY